MNIRNIALKGNVNVFREYLDLGLYNENYSDTCFIFKHCSLDIKDEYWERYNSVLSVICSAILHDYITEPQNIYYGHVQLDSMDYITDDMIVNNKLVFEAILLHMFKNKDIIRKMTMKNIIPGTVVEYNPIYTPNVLLTNSGLSNAFTLHYSSYGRYDYKVLSILIHDNRVIYNNVDITEDLIYTIKEVRKYIHDWCPPINMDRTETHIELEIIIELVEMGVILEGQKFYISMYNSTDDMFIKYCQYANDETILRTYLEGLIELRDKVKPCSILMDKIIIEEDVIELLHELGEDYWSKIQGNITLSYIIDLPHRTLTHLNDILNGSQCILTGSYSCEDLILLYEFIDNMDETTLEYSIDVTDPIKSLSYKRGLDRLWKKYTNIPYVVQFLCNYLSPILHTLSPPISDVYYKFMDENLLSKMHIRHNIKTSDVEIITQ